MNHSMRRALTALLVVMLTAAVATSAKTQLYDFRTVVDSNQGSIRSGSAALPSATAAKSPSAPSPTWAPSDRSCRRDGSVTTLADDANRFSFLGRTLRSTGPDCIRGSRWTTSREESSASSGTVCHHRGRDERSSTPHSPLS
jgi:hypothetical protein